MASSLPLAHGHTVCRQIHLNAHIYMKRIKNISSIDVVLRIEYECSITKLCDKYKERWNALFDHPRRCLHRQI